MWWSCKTQSIQKSGIDLQQQMNEWMMMSVNDKSSVSKANLSGHVAATLRSRETAWLLALSEKSDSSYNLEKISRMNEWMVLFVSLSSERQKNTWLTCLLHATKSFSMLFLYLWDFVKQLPEPSFMFPSLIELYLSSVVLLTIRFDRLHSFIK